MSLVIRAATAADRAAAIQLLIAQLVEHHLPADEAGVARGVELALAPHSPAWLILAFRDSTPVGIFLANQIVSVEKAGSALFIEELYVIPAERRTGIARAILSYVIEEAKRRGVDAFDLEVVPTQVAAFAFWRSLGFIDVNRQRMTRDL
jgi:ribosomal protein S18 acetylase RimI-like enzyme